MPNTVKVDADEGVGGLNAAPTTTATRRLGFLCLLVLIHLLLGCNDGLIRIDIDLTITGKAAMRNHKNEKKSSVRCVYVCGIVAKDRSQYNSPLLDRDGTLGSIFHTLEEVVALTAALPPNVGQIANTLLGLLAFLLVASILTRFLETGLEIGQDLLLLGDTILGLLVGGLRQELLGLLLRRLEIVPAELQVLGRLLLGADERNELIRREAVATIRHVGRGIVHEVEDVVGVSPLLLDERSGIIGSSIIASGLLATLLLALLGLVILVVTVLIEWIGRVHIGHILEAALEHRRRDNTLELLSVLSGRKYCYVRGGMSWRQRGEIHVRI